MTGTAVVSRAPARKSKTRSTKAGKPPSKKIREERPVFRFGKDRRAFVRETVRAVARMMD